MVAALYLLIIAPILAYVVFSVIEIYLTYRIASRRHQRSLLFVQASTEITHTLLVFAYAQFMTTFSELLVDIGDELWWPVALLMATLLLRASWYLLLFYSDKPARWLYSVLLITYLVGIFAIVWGLLIVIPAIVSTGFVPYTGDMQLVLWLGVPALVLFMVPLVAVYRFAFKRLSA